MFACIDIGSNTTRLLVAEMVDGRIRQVAAERAFTCIGAHHDERGELSGAKIDEVATLAARLRHRATRAGARAVSAVATAAVRDATNGAELCAAVERTAGIPVRLLSPAEEAALSFAGARHALGGCAHPVAVADVGGGSTELAVGSGPQPDWIASLPVGSGSLARAHLHDDPPTAAQLDAACAAAAAQTATVTPPPARTAAAVGGTATALHSLAGGRLTPASLRAALDTLAAAPAAATAARLGLPPERARLLPGGIAVLRAVADLFGAPLRVVAGGLREGVVLELATADRR